MKMSITKYLVGFLILLTPLAGQADFYDEESGKAFLGFGVGDIDVTPIVFGADYRFKLDSVDFFDDNDLKLLAGLLFWSASDGPADFSVFEISSGIEKSFDFGKYIVNFGGRLGIANTKASVSVPLFGTVSNSDTSLFISPYGEFLYPLNEQMAIGGEVRLPIYFGDGFDFLDVVYLLASFNYIF